MTLRLPADLDAKLRETAGRQGRSLHETVLVVIDEYVTKRDRKRDALIARRPAGHRASPRSAANP
ncbi:hypothetical protein GCM10009798_15500 [Nocardioides panacihumi]|uniref:Arc family DNA-binding protein n=1 Tax=Nocardioides panacihumi TaxID=400774 RepID=A0ABN2QRE2_9ACTN